MRWLAGGQAAGGCDTRGWHQVFCQPTRYCHLMRWWRARACGQAPAVVLPGQRVLSFFGGAASAPAEVVALWRSASHRQFGTHHKPNGFRGAAAGAVFAFTALGILSPKGFIAARTRRALSQSHVKAAASGRRQTGAAIASPRGFRQNGPVNLGMSPRAAASAPEHPAR